MHRAGREAETKVVNAADAAQLVDSGATVALSGTGCGHLVPEAILARLEERFLASGEPANLTVVHAFGLGDYAATNGRGIERFAHVGFTKTFFGSHYAANVRLQAMLLSGDLAAYVLPAGVLSHLYREIASGRPGILTRIGIGTFVDPELNGARSRPDMPPYVERQSLGGEEYLFYPSFKIDVGIIRGSLADELGNVSLRHEPAIGDTLMLAQAVHNSGGIVIAQVGQLAEAHSIPCRDVSIPGSVVDFVVVEPNEPMTYVTHHNPAYSGQVRVPIAGVEPLDDGPRKIIARRAALALRRGSLVNLGFGVANGVASVLAEEELTDFVTLTVEQGTYGGWPAVGLDAGAAVNHDAVIDVPAQLDFYDGGGLDEAYLSFAEVDPRGRVNVSRFGRRLPGPGGFMDIAHRAGRVVFCGMLTAGAKFEENSSRPVVDGLPKCVRELQQVTYDPALSENKEMPLYVTERAVFEVREGRLTLTELAPGLSVDDIVSAMAFEPAIAADLRPMDAAVFDGERGAVRRALLGRSHHAAFPDGRPVSQKVAHTRERFVASRDGVAKTRSSI